MELRSLQISVCYVMWWCRWEDNIKTDLGKIGFWGMHWIHLSIGTSSGSCQNCNEPSDFHKRRRFSWLLASQEYFCFTEFFSKLYCVYFLHKRFFDKVIINTNTNFIGIARVTHRTQPRGCLQNCSSIVPSPETDEAIFGQVIHCPFFYSLIKLSTFLIKYITCTPTSNNCLYYIFSLSPSVRHQPLSWFLAFPALARIILRKFLRLDDFLSTAHLMVGIIIFQGHRNCRNIILSQNSFVIDRSKTRKIESLGFYRRKNMPTPWLRRHHTYQSKVIWVISTLKYKLIKTKFNRSSFITFRRRTSSEEFNAKVFVFTHNCEQTALSGLNPLLFL